MKHKNSTKPTITVCIITYNHAPYIERAISSVLSQDIDLPFDIIVSDDASDDGTIEILERLKSRNPAKLNLILHKHNIGAAQNWKQLIQYPNTKYIAYLEGDDYWIDNRKLEKQVALLESRRDVSLCFHDAVIHNNLSGTKRTFPTITKNLFTTRDVLIRSWFCPSSSVVFRKEVAKALPEDIESYRNGDILLLFLASEHGNLARITEVMSEYSYLSSNSMSSQLNTSRGKLKNLNNFLLTLDGINRISKKTITHWLLIRKIKIFLQKIKYSALIRFSG